MVITSEYIRFEVYVPTQYRVETTDPSSGQISEEIHALDSTVLRSFLNATMRAYGGVTQSNPVSAAPYKGWWRARPGSPVFIDYLTYVFGLARMDQQDLAISHFDTWKTKLEQTLHQHIILIVFSPVRVIGDFL